jgi:uncharacterized membrane protein
MQIKVKVEINAAAEDVFDYVVELSNNPEWQSGVESTERTSELPIEVGTRWTQTLDNGTTVEYVATALQPGKSITVQTESGPAVVGEITRTVQKLDVDRSRVRMDLTGRARGWRVILTPLMRRMITNSISADYRRLKKRLEPFSA